MQPAPFQLEFQMAHNTWVPISDTGLVSGNFSWYLPLYTHDHPPKNIQDLFLNHHNFSSCLGKASNFVVLVSRLVPYLLISQVLTLIYRLGFSITLYCLESFHLRMFIMIECNYIYNKSFLSCELIVLIMMKDILLGTILYTLLAR